MSLYQCLCETAVGKTLNLKMNQVEKDQIPWSNTAFFAHSHATMAQTSPAVRVEKNGPVTTIILSRYVGIAFQLCAQARSMHNQRHTTCDSLLGIQNVSTILTNACTRNIHRLGWPRTCAAPHACAHIHMHIRRLTHACTYLGRSSRML